MNLGVASVAGVEGETEELVNARQACAALGVSATYMAALKRKMGIKGQKFFLSTVRQWLKLNQDFKIADVYPRKASPPRDSVGAVVEVSGS